MTKKITAVLLVSVAGGLNALLWASAAGLFPKQDPNAILHYTAISGIDFIGQGAKIFTLPLAGALLLLLNMIIGLSVYRTEPRAAWLLWGMSVLIQGILVVSFSLLLYVNLYAYR